MIKRVHHAIKNRLRNHKPSMGKMDVLILVLLLITVSLGIALYFKNNPIAFSGWSDFLAQKDTVKNSNSEEEMLVDDLFKPIPPDASEEYKIQHFELIIKSAQAADRIDVSNCKINPPVAAIIFGKKINFRNSGKSQVKILVEAINKSYTLPIGDSAHNIVFDFPNGAYGYSCGDESGNSGRGIFYITTE